MVLQDTIEVRAALSDVFAFFEDMDNARYLDWHPDHKVFRWTLGKGLKVRNEFYFEEVISGSLESISEHHCRFISEIESGPSQRASTSGSLTPCENTCASKASTSSASWKPAMCMLAGGERLPHTFEDSHDTEQENG